MPVPVLNFSVTGPQAGAVVGRSIAVSGVARVDPPVQTSFPRSTYPVSRSSSGGGPLLGAQLANGALSCTGSLLPSVRGGTQVTLTATLRGTHVPNIGTPTEPEPGPGVPFETRQQVIVQVAVAPPPTFTVTAPADGAVVDLPERGADVEVALTIPGDHSLFPVTISISWDGQTTSEQFTGAQYQKTVPLIAMPLGPRPISVSVANLDSAAPAQTRTVTGRDVTPPIPQVISPQPKASVPADDANGAKTVPMNGTAQDSQSGMAEGSAAVAWALTPAGTRTLAHPLAGNDFSSWTADVPLKPPGFGAHTISVWATDQAGNTSGNLDVPVTVISSYTPKTLEERLSEREYLAALLSFAQEQVSVPGTPRAPRPRWTPARWSACWASRLTG